MGIFRLDQGDVRTTFSVPMTVLISIYVIVLASQLRMGRYMALVVRRSCSTWFLDVRVNKFVVHFHSTFDPALVTASVEDCLRKKECDELANVIDCDEDHVFRCSL